MIVFFRVDASLAIGFGHIVRSLSLAKTLQKLNGNQEVVFILNNSEFAIDLVKKSGFEIVIIDENHTEEQFLLTYFAKKEKSVIVFDNLTAYSVEFIKQLTSSHLTVMMHSYSEGRFYCDLAIYPAAHLPKAFTDDTKWANARTKLLYGFEYSLLNTDILSIQPRSDINKEVKKIGLIAGGSDPTNSLLLFAEWLNSFNFNNLQFYLLFGKGCSYSEKHKGIMLNDNIRFVPFSTEKIKELDIAICAFGISVYELVYLNIPTLTYGHSPKHAEASARFAQQFNCTDDLGLIAQMDKSFFIGRLSSIIENFANREQLFKRCVGLIDGNGAIRISNEINKLMHQHEK